MAGFNEEIFCNDKFKYIRINQYEIHILILK
jgi:hypothetical protein